MLLLIVLSSLIAGILYHAGGLAEGNEDTWIPQFLRHSWVRDWLCPIFSLIVLFTQFHPHVWYQYLLGIPAWVLMAIATSSCWSWLTQLWRGNKNKYAENWFLHGFFIGLAFFPFCWIGLSIGWLLINAFVSGALCTWVSVRTGKSLTEEIGRGFVITITRLFLRS